MSKQNHIKISIPKWTWWQTTKAIALIILVSKVKMSDKLLMLLNDLIKLWTE